MKTLFVSCPMGGRNDEDVKKSIEKMHKIAEIIFEEELNIVSGFVNGEFDCKHPEAEQLSNAFHLMSNADYYIGISNNSSFIPNGCKIENSVANKCKIKSIFLDIKYILSEGYDNYIENKCEKLCIHLPCELGTTVYRVIFKSIHSKENVFDYFSTQFDYEDINLYKKGYIKLTKEEAEKEKEWLNNTYKNYISAYKDTGKALTQTYIDWDNRRKNSKS